MSMLGRDNFTKVNISKMGNPFMPIQSFSTAKTISTILFIPIIKLLIQKMRLLNNQQKILDNLNYFHPFREGNGRTQRRELFVPQHYQRLLCSYAWNKMMKFTTLYGQGWTVYGDLGSQKNYVQNTGKIVSVYKTLVCFKYPKYQRKL